MLEDNLAYAPSALRENYVLDEGPLQLDDAEQRLVTLLDLSGALDVASSAWLCPVTRAGFVGMPLACVGSPKWTEISRAIDLANSTDGLLSDLGEAIILPGDGGSHVICAIGNSSVGRAALFMRDRPLLSSARVARGHAIEKVRQLMHAAWIMRGEAAPRSLIPLEAQCYTVDLAEQCPFGVMILDIEQVIHFANRPVRKLLETPGIIRSVAHRLAISNSRDAIRFQVALRSVLMATRKGDGRQTIALTGPGGAPLLISISKLPGEANEARACLVITRPGASVEPDIFPLAEHFCLTPVEMRLVCQLVKGLNIQEAALTLQLKVQTVRTYLKQVFQKTGTHRQVELVQLMQNGALPVLN